MSGTSLKLIAILGAESTGKTTLAQSLAQQFSCPWVAEYLREFCDEKKRTPRPDEQPSIMDLQVARENLAISLALEGHAPYVFCDTAPLLTAIYSDYVFSDRSLYPEARKLHARYALTLLLLPDIEWAPDGLQRDGAHVQGPIHARLKSALNDMNATVATIQGSGESRTVNAVKAILDLA